MGLEPFVALDVLQLFMVLCVKKQNNLEHAPLLYRILMVALSATLMR